MSTNLCQFGSNRRSEIVGRCIRSFLNLDHYHDAKFDHPRGVLEQKYYRRACEQADEIYGDITCESDPTIEQIRHLMVEQRLLSAIRSNLNVEEQP